MKKIKRDEVEQKIANGEEIQIIDVRETEELKVKKMPEAKHIPIGEIPNRLNELKEDEPYYIICERGNRSGEVTDYLAERGYNAINIIDGMIGWEEE